MSIKVQWAEMLNFYNSRPCLGGIRQLWELPNDVDLASIEFVVVPKPSEYTQPLILIPRGFCVLLVRLVYEDERSADPRLDYYYYTSESAYCKVAKVIKRLPTHTPIHVELHYSRKEG